MGGAELVPDWIRPFTVDSKMHYNRIILFFIETGKLR